VARRAVPGEAPAARPIAELKLPGVETFKLDNGLEVYLVRRTSCRR
jgi:predicted Zn-dependent peptidase